MEEEQKLQESRGDKVKRLMGGGFGKERRNEMYFGTPPKNMYPKHRDIEHIHELKFSGTQINKLYSLSSKQQEVVSTVESDTKETLIRELVEQSSMRRGEAEEVVKDMLANEEEIYFVMQIPHAYREGSDGCMHLHFAFDTDTVGDYGRWGLEYTWTSIGSPVGSPITIYADTILTTGSNSNTHLLAEFPTVSGQGKKISSMLVCRLFRNSSVDDYTGDLLLMEVDLHYQIDTPGSKEETDK